MNQRLTRTFSILAGGVALAAIAHGCGGAAGLPAAGDAGGQADGSGGYGSGDPWGKGGAGGSGFGGLGGSGGASGAGGVGGGVGGAGGGVPDAGRGSAPDGSDMRACEAYCRCMSTYCPSLAPANCQATCMGFSDTGLTCRMRACQRLHLDAMRDGGSSVDGGSSTGMQCPRAAGMGCM